jgi:hypothetical protein
MSIFFIFWGLVHVCTIWNDYLYPDHHFSVYCDPGMNVCQIEDDLHPESGIMFRTYPTECVNGTWMQVNRTGYPSNQENVFDVGPWNPVETVWGGCED